MLSKSNFLEIMLFRVPREDSTFPTLVTLNHESREVVDMGPIEASEMAWTAGLCLPLAVRDSFLRHACVFCPTGYLMPHSGPWGGPFQAVLLTQTYFVYKGRISGFIQSHFFSLETGVALLPRLVLNS
jgi:hypothetical protein